jgi:hypothetical protein
MIHASSGNSMAASAHTSTAKFFRSVASTANRWSRRNRLRPPSCSCQSAHSLRFEASLLSLGESSLLFAFVSVLNW